MLTIQEIDKLLALARMEIPAEEKEKLRTDIDSILNYIDQLKEAAAKAPKTEKVLNRNVLRGDDQPSVSGKDTAALVAAAPESQDGYVKVKKIM